MAYIKESVDKIAVKGKKIALNEEDLIFLKQSNNVFVKEVLRCSFLVFLLDTWNNTSR